VEIYQLLEVLPHRYPFLLVDRVLEASSQHFKVLKNVTYNEPYFQGHFPGYPIMPGVLLVEAMAQAAVASVVQHPEYTPGSLVFLVEIEEARFRKPVIPGDSLTLEGELLRFRRGLGQVHVEAKVNGEVRAEAKLSFMIRREA
jgi:3-hydroxyacyl-[acyl-carrier-protein] dehydratase